MSFSGRDSGSAREAHEDRFSEPEANRASGRAVQERVLRRYSVPGLVASGLSVLVAQDALGYCRQNSCYDTTHLECPTFEEPDQCISVEEKCERDANGCVIEGNTLHRKSSCLTFAVAKGNASAFGLTDQAFLDIVTEAFRAWSEVDCGGGRRPAFVIQSAGLVTSPSAYYCSEASQNTNTWLLTRPWKHDSALLGYETSTSSSLDGEILDADVELNVDKILKDFPSQNKTDVLLAIVTHEAGHFLGLGHSPDVKAVMYEAYSRTGLSARPLSQDDIDGICATFPPSDLIEACAAPAASLAGLDDRACQTAASQNNGASGSGTGATMPSGARGCSVGKLEPKAAGWSALVLFVGLLPLASWRRCGPRLAKTRH